jgi:carbamoyl-phosphate synthase large subunit
MAELRLNGNIVGTDIDPLAPAFQVVDQRHIVPRYSSPEFIHAIRRICWESQIGLVLPLIDPDIPILAAHRGELQKFGTLVGVVSLDAAKICADKLAVCEFFRTIGLTAPKCWLPHELAVHEHSFPRFVKPRYGSAATNTFRANNQNELTFFQDYVPEAIIQECLVGPEITSDIVCDFNGQLLSIVQRQRIAVRTGEVVKGFTVNDPGVAIKCRRIAESLPAIGPITAQCIVQAGVPHFIEINARLGGGLPLAIAAGVDVPRLLLAAAAGIPQSVPLFGEYQLGLHITRFDDLFFISKVGDV